MKLMFATALAVLFALPAAAAQCVGIEAGRSMLAARFNETVREEQERAAPGSDLVVLWQIWHNPETGTWSFTGTARGAICMFASGRDYDGQTIDDFLLGQPS